MDEFITQVSHIGILGLEDESHSSSPPIPEEVQIDDSSIYRIERQLGKGATGLVCAVRPIGPSTLSGQTGLHAEELWPRSSNSFFSFVKSIYALLLR